jgi:hypothetical protein
MLSKQALKIKLKKSRQSITLRLVTAHPPRGFLLQGSMMSSITRLG